MRDLSIAIHNQPAIHKNTRRSSALTWNLAILISIVALGMTYLFQINSLGTKGYNIRSLETKIKQQEADRKQLEVTSSSLKSITRIEQEAKNKNFVPVSKANYIGADNYAMR
ncbi:MAG: hypothetical protein ACM3KM_03220 [Acidobacteriaceae bacterium]